MAPPLIKGYLPVRLWIPQDDKDDRETFVYVKEHQEKGRMNSDTLFVLNAPIVPHVDGALVLKSIFGRYGEVKRVTLIENIRNKHHKSEEEILSWTDKFRKPSFLPPLWSDGKFAHVVFESSKEMKNSFKALGKVMSKGDLPGISLDKLEIQTLADATERQRRENLGEEVEDADNDAPPSGILAVAERYRKSCISEEELMKECNSVMEEFEEAEEHDRLARDSAGSKPDEDGFVTVSYTPQVGSKRELEGDTKNERRSTRNKKSRKKKQGLGASELSDFYRFQTKGNRKRTLHDLRQRFEEDLAKVKKLKENRQYRPF